MKMVGEFASAASEGKIALVLPTQEDYILGNQYFAHDMGNVIYMSVPYFVKSLKESDPLALEMLFTGHLEGMIEPDSAVWSIIEANKEKALAVRMDSFTEAFRKLAPAFNKKSPFSRAIAALKNLCVSLERRNNVKLADHAIFLPQVGDIKIVDNTYWIGDLSFDMNDASFGDLMKEISKINTKDVEDTGFPDKLLLMLATAKASMYYGYLTSKSFGESDDFNATATILWDEIASREEKSEAYEKLSQMLNHAVAETDLPNEVDVNFWDSIIVKVFKHQFES